jgi:hypothetical protein
MVPLDRVYYFLLPRLFPLSFLRKLNYRPGPDTCIVDKEKEKNDSLPAALPTFGRFFSNRCIEKQFNPNTYGGIIWVINYYL